VVFTIQNPRRSVQVFKSISLMRTAAWKIWSHHTEEVRNVLFAELRNMTTRKSTKENGATSVRDVESIAHSFTMDGMIFDCKKG